MSVVSGDPSRRTALRAVLLRERMAYGASRVLLRGRMAYGASRVLLRGRMAYGASRGVVAGAEGVRGFAGW